MSALVAVTAVGLLAVVGLVHDGGQVIEAQARARDLAANAARAGAQEVDLDTLRSDGSLVLDPERAAAAAQAFLERHDVGSQVKVHGRRITVTVAIVQDFSILPGPAREVRATDSAEAVPGLTQGDEASA